MSHQLLPPLKRAPRRRRNLFQARVTDLKSAALCDNPEIIAIEVVSGALPGI